MNKSQLILLWIGAAVFVFCSWNPSIMPYYRYRSVEVEYTDEEWERELSQYDLSLADANRKDKLNKLSEELAEELAEEFAVAEERAIVEGNKPTITGYVLFKSDYIAMLLKGERPSRLVKKAYTYYTRLFNSNLTSLFTRLLSVTVITALVVYTLGDKNRVKVKEILQPLIRFEPKMDKKPKDDQNQ